MFVLLPPNRHFVEHATRDEINEYFNLRIKNYIESGMYTDDPLDCLPIMVSPINPNPIPLPNQE